MSWKNKKQNVVARSSTEMEYRAMTLTTCELFWLKQLIMDLKFGDSGPMQLICDNQATFRIASNPIFHERTKLIEIGCHFVRYKLIFEILVSHLLALMTNWLILSRHYGVHNLPTFVPS